MSIVLRYFNTYYSFIFCLSFLLSGCATTVESNHSSFRDGVVAARALRDRYGAVNAPEANNYLEYIGSRLTQALRMTRSGQPPFHVTLLRTDSPLAYAPGGGEIFVSVGLLKKLRNEAEFAFVISHEYAHEVLNHLSPENSTLNTEKELQADRFAVGLVAAAGYNPYAAVKAIQSAYQFLRDEGSGLTHPSPEERIRSVFEALASAHWTPPGTVDRRDFQHLKRLAN